MGSMNLGAYIFYKSYLRITDFPVDVDPVTNTFFPAVINLSAKYIYL